MQAGAQQEQMALTRWLICGEISKGLFTEMWVGCEGTRGLAAGTVT